MHMETMEQTPARPGSVLQGPSPTDWPEEILLVMQMRFSGQIEIRGVMLHFFYLFIFKQVYKQQ